jgi:ABC-type uncharacterized transport system permease subunit
LLFGALDNGSQAMQRSQGVSPVLVQVIQGLVIVALLAFDTSTWSSMREVLWSRRTPMGATASDAVAEGGDA